MDEEYIILSIAIDMARNVDIPGWQRWSKQIFLEEKCPTLVESYRSRKPMEYWIRS